MEHEFNGFEMQEEDGLEARRLGDNFNKSDKRQWFGSRHGVEEEGTKSRNIWELVFSGLGLWGEGRERI